MKYYYITNNPNVAKICDDNGVIPWIDLETLGKEERQKGMNTVKSKHSIEDIREVKSVLKRMPLMVRVNPINQTSKIEIEQVISNGADIIMLPMFKTKVEIETFISLVNKRAKICLLFETKESIEKIDEILCIKDIDYVHIGLNDLHLSYGLNFMFELITNGMVEKICNKFKEYNIPYGFGGVARLGLGAIPAEFILLEHERLKSNSVILSRSFCNIENYDNIIDFKNDFKIELNKIESFLEGTSSIGEMFIKKNQDITMELVNNVVKENI